MRLHQQTRQQPRQRQEPAKVNKNSIKIMSIKIRKSWSSKKIKNCEKLFSKSSTNFTTVGFALVYWVRRDGHIPLNKKSPTGKNFLLSKAKCLILETAASLQSFHEVIFCRCLLLSSAKSFRLFIVWSLLTKDLLISCMLRSSVLIWKRWVYNMTLNWKTLDLYSKFCDQTTMKI